MLEKLPIACLSLLLVVTPVPLITDIAQSQAIRDLQQEKVDRLIKQLQSADISVKERNRAILELGKIGSDAESACRYLLSTLFYSPQYVRVNSSNSILQIVKSSQSEIKQLFPLLSHPNPDIRANVAASIGRLIDRSQDTLYRLNPMLIYRAQETNNRKVRSNLIAAKNSIEATQKSMHTQLIPLFKDANRLVRANAAFATYGLSISPRLSIPQLIPLLQDPDARVRANTVAALGAMGTAAKSVIPQILLLLKDSEPTVRAVAVHALPNIQKSPKSTLPHLLPMLKDPERGVRSMSVLMILGMGELATTAIPDLIPLLQDPARDVRVETARVLESMSESARSKFPQLEQLLDTIRSEERDTRQITALTYVYVIDKQSSNSELFNLVPLLKDADPQIRWIAIDALGDFGDEAKSTIPQIMPLLQDPDRNVVNKARSVLKKLQELK